MIMKLFVSIIISAVSLTSLQAEEVLIPAPPRLDATSYLLVDADTGTVLVEHEADKLVHPASLTKMMTSYIVSAEVERNRVSEDDMVNISVKAWRMGGSRMFLREGTKVRLKDLLRGVIIQSGNDASVALAEHLAGSEEAFVDIMNQQAIKLGMTNTNFVNSTGWPHEEHLTTAQDLAILARAVINDYPKHFALYSEKSFTYNGITQPNRNLLLFRDETVDGLKTGHTEAAGYCLVASAKRKGMRLIAVVLGTKSEKARAAETQKLLTYGFQFFQRVSLYSANDTLKTERVWYGTANELSLGVADDIWLTIPVGKEKEIQTHMQVDRIIKAPIAEGQRLGKLTVELNGEILAEVPLIAQNRIDRAGFISRMIDSTRLFFKG